MGLPVKNTTRTAEAILTHLLRHSGHAPERSA